MNPQAAPSFVELFLHHQRRIYGFILTVVPDVNAADEIFQETSLILWRKADQFDASRDFVRWGCGIAVNVIRNFRARRRSDRHRFGDELLTRIADRQAEDVEVLEERRRALAGCLEKLPDDDRGFIQRCYGGELTIQQIAERAGRTENSLYQRLHRLRRRLLDCIRGALSEEPVS